MPLLSVIVPVYNVESYLEECLDSILNQSFRDLEIICINDGSTDSSLAILRRKKEEDGRIQIIDQTNQGVSSARNKGLKISTGNYISFVDGDDFLDKEAYSFLMDKAFQFDLDVLLFNFQTYPNKVPNDHGFITNQLVDVKSLLTSNNSIQSKNSLCFTWRFIFRRSLLLDNHLYFESEIAIGEDMIYNIEVLFYAQKIMAFSDVLYYYRINNATSAMSKKYKPDLEKSLTKMYEIKERQIKKYQMDSYTPYTVDLAKYTLLQYIPLFFNNIKNNPDNINVNKEISKILSMKIIRDAVKTIGYKNIYPTKKEYLFYLAMKFKCTRLVHKIYFK